MWNATLLSLCCCFFYQGTDAKEEKNVTHSATAGRQNGTHSQTGSYQVKPDTFVWKQYWNSWPFYVSSQKQQRTLLKPLELTPCLLSPCLPSLNQALDLQQHLQQVCLCQLWKASKRLVSTWLFTVPLLPIYSYSYLLLIYCFIKWTMQRQQTSV